MITKVFYQECEGNPSNLITNQLYRYDEFIKTHPAKLLEIQGEWIPFGLNDGHDYAFRVYAE